MGYENSGLVERIEQDIFVRGPYTQQQLQEIIEAGWGFLGDCPGLRGTYDILPQGGRRLTVASIYKPPVGEENAVEEFARVLRVVTDETGAKPKLKDRKITYDSQNEPKATESVPFKQAYDLR